MKINKSLSLASLFLLIACLSQSAQAQQQFNITPFLDCIDYDAATDTVTAHFGYNNREHAIVQILIGNNNRFVPNPADRGQNILFLPGLHQRAFSVTAPGNSVTQWIFQGQALPFSHNPEFYCSQPSNVAPRIVPFLTSVQVNGQTGQATATFGYFSAFGGEVRKGSSNYFSFSGNPTGAYPGDRGQPTNFQAGSVRNAFQVTFNPATEPAVTWNLLGQSVVAAPPASPTAASVGLSGRLRNAGGSGIAQARLILTNSSTLETARAQTNSFGHYRFEDVQAGEAYLLEVKHKRYSFSPQIVQLFETREDFDLTAEK